jgi:adenine-specific DNA-methyltransferase
MTDQRQTIADALMDFESRPLREAGISFFEALGYHSERRLTLQPNTVETFLTTFDQKHSLPANAALYSDVETVDFLFQLTDAEIRQSDGQADLPFASKGVWDGAAMESYLFLAVELKDTRHTRTRLSGITREINRLFPMPAMVLFRHGDTLTLAIIRRRLHKRDATRDVVERKVTLIKDIRFADPLRAHIEILNDLSLPVLRDEFYFHNFVGLHLAWEKRLDTYQLNERFYRDIANWYFWALQHPGVKFPRAIAGIRDNEERARQESIFLIRLLTRLIFCWFLQEKRLIPRDLFRLRTVEELLADLKPQSGTYYRAFLQNLFFGTLNQEIGKREFRKKNPEGRDPDRGTTNAYRYDDLFVPGKTRAFLELLRRIPFVNGGLFDCLDVVFKKEENKPDIRLDDFSEERKSNMCMPNELFFCEEHSEDLSDAYKDSRRKKEKVRGLIDILARYKFTVEENTPLEEEIALDPELLGKVFENLLASYNEDTKTTARKALGAFYTPREIVSYMVDESLIAYLKPVLAGRTSGRTKGGIAAPPSANAEGEIAADPTETKLRSLFSSLPADFETPFSPKETEAMIFAIDRLKVLDPACGSGAFPMGVLHRLVDLLAKLDPNNRQWKERQLAKVQYDRTLAERMQDDTDRDSTLRQITAREEDIVRSFDTRFHQLDFARKLYLIENCIYGVDILPIACQIAKLRFFIALIVDQDLDADDPNVGFRPLPNLETRIVAANTLIPIEKPEHQMDLLDMQVRPLRSELEQVRHDHFSARTPSRKAKCRMRDAELRAKIAELLEQNGMPAEAARDLAAWDPYDQNHAATFFDPEWMFGIPVGKVRITDKSPATLRGNLALVNDLEGQMELGAKGVEVESGFDIAIGNPPYVRIQTLKQQDPKAAVFLKEHYRSAGKGNYDLYVVFVERGLQLLRSTGNLAYILPHKFFNAKYGEPLRGLIAEGKHLKHVVHFGDQQVFPGASNYVCLLFLSTGATEWCRYVKVENLSDWLRTFKGAEARVPADRIGPPEWNIAVGDAVDVITRLETTQQKLHDVATRIFQGIKTSADNIYIVDELARDGDTVTVFSHQTQETHALEATLLHPLIKGGDSRAYQLDRTKRLIIFPYASAGDTHSRLIAEDVLAKRYQLTWKYFLDNRSILEKREHGAFRNNNWYAYGRAQALDVIARPKLFTPDLAPRASFSFDASGESFFTGGVAGGYGILPESGTDPYYLLALLNSRAVDYYHHHVATQMRGGWYSYESRFIRNLPIARAQSTQMLSIRSIAHQIVWMNAKDEVVGSPHTRDALLPGYWEQLVNSLVYELYFPEELHNAGIHMFNLVEDANLPNLDSIPEHKRLACLRQEFERLYDAKHPIRAALNALRSLETVRIIEGEE